MKKLLACTALLGLAVSSAAAETRYDRSIERAATAIVAAKIGTLRGGFSFDARLVFVTPSDAVSTGSVADSDGPVSVRVWRHGLAPAVEGKAAPTHF